MHIQVFIYRLTPVSEFWVTHNASLYGEMDMNVKNNNILTPVLRKLMEACLIQKITDIKTLTTHLIPPYFAIRTELQRILTSMKDGGSNTTAQNLY
jgi:hypothetical protein